MCGAAIGYQSPPFHCLSCGVHFLRCVHAEWLLLRPRLTRTRLGVFLLALAISLVWLQQRGVDPVIVSLHAGALGAVLGAGFMVGAGRDRAAFATALGHPTTPLAIAVGRWVAIAVPAIAVTLACTIPGGWQPGAVVAGSTAALAVAGCALVVVLAGGSGAAVALFLLMAIAGSVSPERLIGLAHPGALRVAAASVLELGPALWHYRDVATGDLGAVLHGGAWAGLGIILASGLIAWRRA